MKNRTALILAFTMIILAMIIPFLVNEKELGFFLIKCFIIAGIIYLMFFVCFLVSLYIVRKKTKESN